MHQDKINEQVQNHFNNKNRIQEDIDNYSTYNCSDQKLVTDPYEQPREDYIFELIKKNNLKILDIGCGIGNLVKRLAQAGHFVYGVDLSDKMIETAKSLLEKNKINANLLCMDFLDYPESEKFDYIIANGVIWYYPDKSKFLAKIKRILSPNGKCIIVHRNLLFNFFALNQGTIDLLNNNMFSKLPNYENINITQSLAEQIPNLTQAIKNNNSLPKPYDNPLTISNLYNRENLTVTNTYYCYIHPAPPRLNLRYSNDTYKELQFKFGNQWQGMFMGSQFIVEARHDN